MTMKTRIKQLTATQKEFHKKWLLALRSPRKYPKTRRSLHDQAGFCCLGVGLSLCGVKWEQDPGITLRLRADEKHRDLTEMQMLTRKGRAKFGLTPAEMNDLTRINDSADTFVPVREYIRNLMKHREEHYRIGRRD